MRRLNEITKYMVFLAMSLGLFFSTAYSQDLAETEEKAVKGERMELEGRTAEEEQKAWESYGNCILTEIKNAKQVESRSKKKTKKHHGKKLTKDSCPK